MKGKLELLMVLAAICPLSIQAQGTVADISASLKNLHVYNADAKFSVTLPQNDTDVVYDVNLQSITHNDDPYAPCEYLINWTLDAPSGEVKGFSAYFDGNHYRYRDNRLQEYHVTWDSIPFLPSKGTLGVQGAAQFADLLPQYIALELDKMMADPRYTLTVIPDRNFNGRKAVVVRSVMDVNDVTVMEKEFTFDAGMMIPLRIDTESNPGSITEQSVLVDYTVPTGGMGMYSLSEEELIGMYPEVFEKYRESNFRIENLPSTPLPTFSLPTTTGERYTYHRGDKFATPTIIALLDPSTSFNNELISAVRNAVDQLPYTADVIWVFNSTNVDVIEEIIPSIRPGEHALINGKGLARDCGASSLPVIIMVGSDGIVKNVNLGFNNEVENIVLQSMALVN